MKHPVQVRVGRIALGVAFVYLACCFVVMFLAALGVVL